MCSIDVAVYIYFQDPMIAIKEACGNTAACVPLSDKYTECNDRVNSRKKTDEICAEELFDYLHCVDACVSICNFHCQFKKLLFLL